MLSASTVDGSGAVPLCWVDENTQRAVFQRLHRTNTNVYSKKKEYTYI
jgi:hypothetical protein